MKTPEELRLERLAIAKKTSAFADANIDGEAVLAAIELVEAVVRNWPSDDVPKGIVLETINNEFRFVWDADHDYEEDENDEDEELDHEVEGSLLSSIMGSSGK